MSDNYYGHYRSSTSGESGCVREFITTPHLVADFPVSVLLPCPLCRKTHGFIFAFSHFASTPKQRAQLEAWSVSRDIGFGVAL